MAVTAVPLLDKVGFVSKRLGTSSDLAFALGTSQGATRTGLYGDLTGGAEKLGFVVNGVERLAATFAGATVTGTLSAGALTLTQVVSTSGSPVGLVFTGAAHTTLTASAESSDLNFNLARTVQFATGALTTQRAMRIQAPTYSFVGASTLTNAATVAIGGAPVAGTNATITNTYAFWVESGASRFDGAVSVTSTTASTTPTNGALVVSGGIGVAGAGNFGADVYCNGLRVGRGVGDNVNNSAIGAGALDSNTTGGFNTAVGSSALRDNTTGPFNTAVGSWTLLVNTTGGFNTAVGSFALSSNTTGYSNTAVGSGALGSNTTGVENSALGVGALQSNTTGGSNSAMGVNALQTNTTGNANSALGVNALQFNLSGSNNTAMGASSLNANTTGSSNTSLGVSALQNNTIGGSNSAMGMNALQTNIGGVNNSALGVNALRYNTEGSNNAAVGVSALQNNTTGGNNTAIGRDAGLNVTTSFNVVAIGFSALSSVTTSGQNSTAVGAFALNLATVAGNTALGSEAGLTTTTGTSNIYLGHRAGDSTAASASNRLVAGSSDAAIVSVFIGNGETNGSPQAITYNATGGSGTNIGGAALTLAGGRNTGSGVGGAVVIQTTAVGASSATAGTLLNRFSILGDGGVLWTGIATASEPAVSTSNNGAIFFDATLQKFRVSQNGAAYVDLVGGGGTVTSVSVTTANGVSGSVATATTTPAITITLGAITPTSVASSGAVSGTTGTFSGAVAGSNLSGTNTGDQTITLTGNVTGSGTGSFATTIAASAVTLAMQANVATSTILGRVTAATGVVEALTGTQATTLLDSFTSALKGLAPASGGGTTNFLRADGTWVAPAGVPGGSDTQVQFNNAGAFGASANFAYTVSTGALGLSQAVSTSGSPTLLTLTGAAHTTLTASTEATDIHANLARTVQFATGDITSQRAVRVSAPTYSFVGASTITTAATFAISGSPGIGANATATNRYALWVEAGDSFFNGPLTCAQLSSTTLTEGRIPRVTTGGQITDTAFLTLSGNGTFVHSGSSNFTIGTGTTTIGGPTIITYASAVDLTLATTGTGTFNTAITFSSGGTSYWLQGLQGGTTGSKDWFLYDFVAGDTPIFVEDGAGGFISFARPTRVTNTTASTSTITGALTVAGGLGVAGQVSAATLLASGLTSGRVPFVAAGGLLTDGTGLLYSSGTLTAGDGSAASNLILNGAASVNKAIAFQAAGLTMWAIRISTASEDLAIRANDAAGAFIDSPISIVRAAGGAITFARPTTQATNWEQTGATTLSTGTGANSLNGDTTIPGGKTLTVASDTDATTILGRAVISSPTTDVAYFSHFDRANATSYAILQDSFGATYVNAGAGQTMRLRIANANGLSISATSGAFAAGLAVSVANTTASTSTITGALTVAG